MRQKKVAKKPAKEQEEIQSSAAPAQQEEQVQAESAPQPAKTKKNLVEDKYPERWGYVRTVAEIATEGPKTFFRVNYFNVAEVKYTSYFVGVSDEGAVTNDTK